MSIQTQVGGTLSTKGTITVILGGGRGTRLHPLTSVRAKPAVPLGGKYRLIDIPISNALNSGLRQIFVLTQFNSASLNAHVAKTYQFDPFSRGFVEVLAAEQTERSTGWYQGTADAVRQQLHRLERQGITNVLILSGDHLYRMDYRKLIARHEESHADITVSAIQLKREQCEGFGMIRCDSDGMIVGFKEKPPLSEDLSDMTVPSVLHELWGAKDKPYLASMGVYVFRINVLRELLDDPSNNDFGGDVLPKAIHTHGVAVHPFDGYWEDIGTIRSFYEANLSLCEPEPPFHFYDVNAPIYTRARFLPPSVLLDGHAKGTLMADGCLILGANIEHSVIGLRSRINKGATILDSIIMGADYYQNPEQREALIAKGEIPIGVGEGSSIQRAILDKNVRVGRDVIIHGDPNRADEEHADWAVKDGIVIVRKGAVIPDGTVL